jgi:hypothetical protein
VRRLIAHFAREPHGFEAAPADLAKLGARDRAQLVITAYETGLVRAS